MIKFSKILLFSILAVFLLAGSAMATNITVYDNRSVKWDPWYGTQEDNEVEPGMAKGDIWDLESFDLEGSILSMTGTYEFINGALYYGHYYTAGDIFIDIDGDAIYGKDGGEPFKGYDYVFDINWTDPYQTWTLYQLDEGSTLIGVIEDSNQTESDPWQFVYGNEYNKADGNYTVSSSNGHNTVSGFDLASIIGLGDSFTAHFTYECGNDNLIGHVSEPATILLLGTGLIGLAGLGRKRFFKK